VLRGGVPFRPHRRSIDAGGIRLAAYEVNAGGREAPAVLLLHGLGHWSEGAWGRLVPRLDPALRYVALDLPGFGASDKPAGRYDRRFFAAALDAAVEALGLDAFSLVGHSLGGFLAADLAARTPRRVRRLALIAPGGFARSARFAAFGLAARLAPRTFGRRPSRRLVERVLARSVVDPRSLDAGDVERAVAQTADPAMRRAFGAVYAAGLPAFVAGRGLRAELARYDGPVLCAWGARDRFIPARGLRAVAATYPHARTLMLARSAHLPMIEQPDELAAALRPFLAV